MEVFMIVWNTGRETVLFKDQNLWFSRICLEKEEAGHMACEITESVSFLYMKRGTIRCQVNQKQVVLKEGEGLFLNGEMVFRICGAESQVSEALFLGVSTGEEQGIAERYIQTILAQRDFPWYQLERRKEIKALSLLQEVEEQGQNQETGLELLGILCSLLSLIRKEMDTQEGDLTQSEWKEQEKLKRMLCYLHHCYRERLTLEDMAEKSGVSKGEYCRFFKKHMGQTPVEYLQQYRIGKSLSLLRENREGMAEIAGSCGFGGSSYYAEIFKKEMGCAPGEYRKWYLSGGACPILEKKGMGKERKSEGRKQDSMPAHLL